MTAKQYTVPACGKAGGDAPRSGARSDDDYGLRCMHIDDAKLTRAFPATVEATQEIALIYVNE